jgi:hypothetical protein
VAAGGDLCFSQGAGYGQGMVADVRAVSQGGVSDSAHDARPVDFARRAVTRRGKGTCGMLAGRIMKTVSKFFQGLYFFSGTMIILLSEVLCLPFVFFNFNETDGPFLFEVNIFKKPLVFLFLDYCPV